MNTYVFLTFAVHGIGGTQIYVRNKLLFLQKHGWGVKIITSEPGDNIMVKELAPYAKDIVPTIVKNPGICSNREREEALRRMIELVGTSGENVVIETNFMAATPWGEMLAERLHARHLILLIQEDYRLNAPKYQRFFAWKYDRGELAANTSTAILQLLEGYRNIPKDKSPLLEACCSNVVEEYKSPEIDSLIEEADYHIGSIGRLNKPFVYPMVSQLSAFARFHPDKRFQLILFGGSPDKLDIRNILSLTLDNFHIAITGPIFPVPLHLIQKMDVFIASAGGARTSYEAGGITITIDANDYEPIGIMGVDTKMTIKRDEKIKILSLKELLTKILFSDKKFTKPPIVLEDIEREFVKHLDYLKGMNKRLLYYNTRKLWPSFITRILYKIKNLNNILLKIVL
ncbi:MAG: hypothetical protein K5907_06520 [Treponema sp.]|nr:hypothetical protein [Treponema sp.]